MFEAELHILPEVRQALLDGAPVVALESTVITHGLPYPQNCAVAREMEAEIRRLGAVPATIAVLDGRLRIGVTADELERLGRAEGMHKISARDAAPALVLGWSGGTTVAGTMMAAHLAGIRFFATGGIGGVHRQPPNDISADLTQLAKTPILVVCAGAKAILDLDATLEYLETMSVPVVGYQVNEFPAFYSRSSGLRVSVRADTPGEAAAIAKAHWTLGLGSAVLVANPPPAESALDATVVERAVGQALVEAEAQHIRGQMVTPFLLRRVNELTGGDSLRANLDLLLSNARLAAQIATT